MVMFCELDGSGSSRRSSTDISDDFPLALILVMIKLSYDSEGFTNLPVLPHMATFSPGRMESVMSRNA
jgi:hypothetical protein